MTPAAGERQLVTFRAGGQLFGVEVLDICEVFHPQAISLVPMGRPEIAGVMNLRGRIITVLCLRRRLDLPPRAEGAAPPMVLSIERNGEGYGLLVDAVEEVIRVSDATGEPAPGNLDDCWAGVSRGVHRLRGRLLVVLDVARLLDLPPTAAAA